MAVRNRYVAPTVGAAGNPAARIIGSSNGVSTFRLEFDHGIDAALSRQSRSAALSHSGVDESYGADSPSTVGAHCRPRLLQGSGHRHDLIGLYAIADMNVVKAFDTESTFHSCADLPHIVLESA